MKNETLQDILGQVNMNNGRQVDTSTLMHQQQPMVEEDQKNNNWNPYITFNYYNIYYVDKEPN